MPGERIRLAISKRLEVIARNLLELLANGPAVNTILFPDLNVAENVFMGRHPRDRFGRVDWKNMYQGVERLLACLRKDEREILIDLLRRVHSNLDAVTDQGEPGDKS